MVDQYRIFRKYENILTKADFIFFLFSHIHKKDLSVSKYKKPPKSKKDEARQVVTRASLVT